MPKNLLVEAHHKLWWEANAQLATQRHGSKLRPYVTEKPDQGEGAVAANLIQPVRAIRDTGRRRSNISLTAERKRRWLIYRDPIAVGACIDAEDTFRQVGEPTSELIENGAKAIGRGIDGRILGLNQDGAAGILGSIIEGKRPGAAGIALPAGNIALHGGAGRGCAPPQVGAVGTAAPSEGVYGRHEQADRNIRIEALAAETLYVRVHRHTRFTLTPEA